MNNKTKAAFKWIATSALVTGLMVQPAQAGDRYYYKNHNYSSGHQHNSYCHHGDRYRYKHNNYSSWPRRHYQKRSHYRYKRNHGWGHNKRYYYKKRYRTRHRYHTDYHYRQGGNSYIKIRF